MTYPSSCNAFNLDGTVGFHHFHSPSASLLQNVPTMMVPSKSNAATFVELLGFKLIPWSKVWFGPWIQLNSVGLDGFSDSLVKNGCTEHVKSVNANYAQWNAHIHVLFSLAISRRLDGRLTSWNRLPQMTLSDRLFFQMECWYTRTVWTGLRHGYHPTGGTYVQMTYEQLMNSMIMGGQRVAFQNRHRQDLLLWNKASIV